MSDKKNPTVTIETDSGQIVLELYPKRAQHCNNNFACRGRVLTGPTFHRIIKGLGYRAATSEAPPAQLYDSGEFRQTVS